MKIIKATHSDTNAIYNLLQKVAVDMQLRGVMQWNKNYPTLDHVNPHYSRLSYYKTKLPAIYSNAQKLFMQKWETIIA